MEKITHPYWEIKLDDSTPTSDTLNSSLCEPQLTIASNEPLFVEDEPQIFVEEEAIHQDHQARLRELASHYESGLMTLNDEEMLTLVLCPAGRPSKRMARIARQIMHAGGIQGLAREVVNAPFGLRRFGLAQHEIIHLKMAYELMARFHLLQQINRTRIRSVYEAEKLFRAEMMHLDHEEMHVLLLDVAGQIIEYARPYKGTVNSACVRAAEIFRPAILRNSPRIIVCHNHPSGRWKSSREDREVTFQLVQAGELLDIELVDHLILGNPSFTSLKEELQW
jgi:DNA repair protein RadC